MNPNPEDVRRQVVDALEDARDGSLDEERRGALRQLLLENEDARRAYLEFNNLNRLLSTPGSDAPVPVVAPRTTTHPAAAAPPTARGSSGALLVGLLATCAVVLVMVLGVATEQPAPTFATLVDAKGSTWISNTQPSRVGTRLGRGRMHVASGLVTIDFDHGVELVVEGPADFELIGRKRCRLHSGMVVATARPGGEGFVVETPEGIVVDRGTSFGLTAGEAGTDVVVFSGRVDVQDSDDAEPRSIEEGQHVRVTADGVGDVQTEGEPVAKEAESRTSLVRISTADGRGRDTWVQFGEIEPNKTPEDVLLVNRTLRHYRRWQRMAVTRFDLRKVDTARIESVALVLQSVKTSMGHASRIEDAEFAVFGCTDDDLDRWNAKSHRWRKGPWRQKGQFDLDRTTELGRFTIPQGEYGTVVLDDDRLLEFLRGKAGGLATIVIHRITRPSSMHALVHGFASSRHPTLRPPTLELTLNPDE